MKCKKLTALLLTAAAKRQSAAQGPQNLQKSRGGGKMRRRLPVKTAIKKLSISRCL